METKASPSASATSGSALHLTDKHKPPTRGLLLLDQLRSNGVRIAMVTGKGKRSTIITLKKFGLTHHFGQIETGSAEGPIKEQGIAAILRSWPDLDKSSIIYVGDAPSDITASRKAGINVVAAAWAGTADPEKLLANHPDKIFYSVTAFSEWLQSHLSAPPLA